MCSMQFGTSRGRAGDFLIAKSSSHCTCENSLDWSTNLIEIPNDLAHGELQKSS